MTPLGGTSALIGKGVKWTEHKRSAFVYTTMNLRLTQKQLFALLLKNKLHHGDGVGVHPTAHQATNGRVSLLHSVRINCCFIVLLRT